MKVQFLLFIIVSVLFININLPAQIPNPGFENWTDGSPDSWLTNNYPGMMTTLTQSSDAHSGSSAVKGEVVPLGGQLIPPLLTSGSDGQGFSFAQRPQFFNCWFKFSSFGEDILKIEIFLKKGLEIIGYAGDLFISSDTYQKASLEFSYADETVPETCIIQVLIVDTTLNTLYIHQGSSFLLDDLSFEGTATAVKSQKNNPTQFDLKQNYPNPFNPNTTISYYLPVRSAVKITVHNLVGEKIAELVNGIIDAGNHDILFNAGKLPSGVYFYKIEAGSFVQTKKMLLLK